MASPTGDAFLSGRVTLHAGDCLDVLRSMPDGCVDSVVTDPPYALVSIGKRFGKAGSAAVKVPEGGSGAYARASRGFMGKEWDTGKRAFAVEFWSEVLRVLKPGGHVAAFGGTRTYHRLVCAIDDAGFEIRDQLAWAYGAGFPKSHDVSKGIDKALGTKGSFGGPKTAAHAGWIERGALRGTDGHEGYQRPWMAEAEAVSNAARQYQAGSSEAQKYAGWGTALKPAWEPICLARKPLIGTVAANVLAHGTGALNIDGCRVTWQSEADAAAAAAAAVNFAQSRANGRLRQSPSIGKESRDGTAAYDPAAIRGRWPANIVHDGSGEVLAGLPADETGSAARFFYSAKADSDDRIGSKHPTVKPVDLMQWLVRLITPPGGTVLDPFAGTGTTGEAAWREGFSAVLIEREAEYRADVARRMTLCLAGPDERKRESIKAAGRADMDAGPLFGHFADQSARSD